MQGIKRSMIFPQAISVVNTSFLREKARSYIRMQCWARQTYKLTHLVCHSIPYVWHRMDTQQISDNGQHVFAIIEFIVQLGKESIQQEIIMKYC